MELPQHLHLRGVMEGLKVRTKVSSMGTIFISPVIMLLEKYCLHTTLALTDDKSDRYAHTVPQALLKQNSTLPSRTLGPPLSLISPSEQLALKVLAGSVYP